MSRKELKKTLNSIDKLCPKLLAGLWSTGKIPRRAARLKKWTEIWAATNCRGAKACNGEFSQINNQQDEKRSSEKHIRTQGGFLYFFHHVQEKSKLLTLYRKQKYNLFTKHIREDCHWDAVDIDMSRKGF